MLSWLFYAEVHVHDRPSSHHFCDARGTTTSAQHTIFQNSQDLTDHHYHPTYNSSNQFFNSFILFIHLPPSQVHFHTTAQTIALHLMFSWLVTLCRCCYLLCNTFFSMHLSPQESILTLSLLLQKGRKYLRKPDAHTHCEVNRSEEHENHFI